MKKFALLSGLLLIIAGHLIAQQKTGFSDTDDIDPLLEYRLPDRGYSNFVLNFSSVGNRTSSLDKSDADDLERKSSNIDGILNPEYNLYRESEARIFSLNSDLLIRYGTGRNENISDNSLQESRNFDGEINIDADLREYLSSSLFLLADQTARVEYSDESDEQEMDGMLVIDQEDLERRFSSRTRLGFGVGRVRNVTPVIRAIRLRERYGVIAGGNTLSDEQVQSAADVFTRFDSYQQRYDRPEKQFWEAMDQAVNGSFGKTEPFDLFYLSDVLDENLGSRLEGWDASVGGEFGYSNNLIRSERPFDPDQPDLRRSLNVSKSAAIFAQARWYKNLSLAHQIGVTADASRSYPLDTDTFTKWSTGARLQLNWLWNMSDRFLLNTLFINTYDAIKREEDRFFDAERIWNSSSILNSDITYFIENHLAFNFGLSYSLIYNGESESETFFDSRDTLLRFNAGIRYYFSRNLY